MSAALVKDININSSGSNPSDFTVVGTNVFFKSSDLDSSGSPIPRNTALWFSDGTTAGTTKVRVFSSPGQGVLYLTAYNGALYFVTQIYDGNGYQVWRSDGTNAGTVKVTQFPASGNTYMRLWSAGGKLYIYADDGTHGYELFASDGTWAGTQILKDLNPGSASSDAGGLIELNGQVYFFANDGIHGQELFKTDGTTAGTSLVADITPGSASTGFWGEPLALSNALVFTCNGEGKGLEPWHSDGSAAGTGLLVDIRPGSAAGFPLGLSRIGSRVYFTADDGTTGREPWITDGTTAGTYQIADLNPGTLSSNASGALDVNGVAVFSGEVGSNRGIFATDGTAGNVTQLVAMPTASVPNGAATILAAVGGVGYFSWNDPVNGTELWRTDGTAANTFRISDYAPGSRSSYFSQPKAFLGRLICTADDTISGDEPFVSDGTAPGTQRLKECGGPAFGSSPGSIVHLNGKAIFAGAAEITVTINRSDGQVTRGRRDGIFVSDGTENGTVPLRLDVAVSGIVVIGDLAYFNISGGSDSGFWRTDGTPAGTIKLLSGIGVSTLISDGANRTTFLNGYAYFAAGAAQDYELWRSDGTPDGTTRVIDLFPGTVGSTPRSILTWKNALYFTAFGLPGGIELYTSDGSAAGTHRVADINPSGDAFYSYENAGPAGLVATDDYLYFAADDGIHGFELWRSDGTDAGTTLVKDIRPGNQSGMPQRKALAALGNLIFTPASAAYLQERMWVSDGTDLGTIPLTPLGTSYQPAVVLGSKAVFSTYNSTTVQYTLWASDGTQPGTVALYTAPSNSGDIMTFKAVVGPHVYFNATDAAHGTELWRTDGTIGGTGLHSDIEPGVASSSPFGPSSDLSPPSGNLFFAATRSDVGGELWRVSAADAEPLALSEKLATPTGDTQLSWTFPGGGETGFVIERGTTPSSFLPLGTANAGEYSIVDHTALLNTQYYYRVRATLVGFDSSWSNIISVNHAADPAAPNLLTDSDSGSFNNDDLTNASVLRLSVPAPVGTSVRMFVDGVAAGVFDADTRGTAWIELPGIPEGSHALTAQIVFSSSESSSISPALNVTVDRTIPSISASAFQVDLDAPTFQFVLSEASSVSLLPTQYFIKNKTTNTVLDNSKLATQYDALTRTMSITAPGLAGGLFADGNYYFAFNNGLGIPISDLAGNAISLSGSWNFYSLAGDANLDRVVNTLDFNILAGNFGTGDKFSLADFNYDNTVDSQDFTILVGRFGKRLAASAPVAASPSIWSGLDNDDDSGIGLTDL